MNQNQYTRTLSFKVREALEAIFDTIKAPLIQAVDELPGVGSDDYTPEDAARDITRAKFGIMTREFVKTILFIFPDNICVVQVANELLDLVRKLVNTLYTEIDIAKRKTTKVSDTIAQIKRLNQKAQSLGVEYINMMFDLYRNDKIWPEEIEDDLASFQNVTVTNSEIWMSGIARANIILAQATSGDTYKCKEDLVATVDTIENEVISATMKTTTAITNRGILMIRVTANTRPDECPILNLTEKY